MPRVSVKGLLLWTVLISTVYFGSHTFLLPPVFLLFVSPRAYRRFVDAAISTWNWLIVAVLELVYGVKVKIFGEFTPLPPDQPILVIMNHRTRFDWMFMWSFFLRCGSLGKHKIIMKNALKHIPGIGWAVQMQHSIFLHRNWGKDQQLMTDTLQHFRHIQYSPHLLIFPEGTDLSEYNRRRDWAYAEKNGLCRYEYVMHPRTTGFVHCAQQLCWSGKIHVYDVTVGYIGAMPQDELHLLAGDFPSEVCYHVAQYQLDADDKDFLGEWLKTKWDEKEERLKHFYQQKKFPGPRFQDNRRAARGKMLLGMLLWGVVLSGYLASMLTLPLVWVHAVAMTAIHLCVDQLFGGWDSLAIKQSRKDYAKQ